jgi:regulator of protease activity HflC (stomatin/prohibitin superfamily)
VVTDPVTLKGPSGDWRLIGSVGFDGTLDYAVSGTLPPEVVEKLAAKSALAAGALSDPEGKILLDLKVRGKAIAPQVSWDGNAMRNRLAGKASQALEAQRAKLEAEAQATAQKQLAAAEDSARRVVERTQRAATDSLRRRAGDLLKGFFNSPRDTTKHP